MPNSVRYLITYTYLSLMCTSSPQHKLDGGTVLLADVIVIAFDQNCDNVCYNAH